MRHKKIGGKFKKTVAVGLIVSMALGSATLRSFAKDVSDDSTSGSKTESSDSDSKSSVTSEEYSSERISTIYTNISKKYKLSDYTGEAVSIPVDSSVTGNSKSYLTTKVKGYEKNNKVLDLTSGKKVTLDFEVPEDGLYYMNFDYLSYDESILPVSMKMKVDGDYPFYECRSLEFETTWKLSDEPSYDRYDNEAVTIPNKQIQWESKYLMDSSYRHSDPLKVQLTKGKHSIELSVDEGNFLLGNISLEAPVAVEEYKGSSDKADGKELITIQGEDYTTTNDSAIHGVAEYDTSVDPYQAKDTVLNTLDSDSFSTAGRKVTYEFEVKTAGNYKIAANYRQSEKTDFPVFCDVAIDGKVPNSAFKDYSMAYTTKYKTATMQDSKGEDLSVHLEAGKHTISYTISMNPISYIMEEIDEVMSDVNDLALEITKVAGTNADKYRDLKLSKYIPNLEKTLYSYSDRLTKLEKSAVKWSDSDKNVAVMSSLIIAAKQLKSLADSPDSIPYRIDELSTSSNSVNHYLATTIDNLIANDLAIDRIYIYQDGAKLPSKPGFFKSCAMNISRFVASFTDQAYSTKNTNSDHIQVWVNRSSQYVQIMQKMIDEKFTPKTGINVDISIMPDQYKLVLSNSSGNAPDVATGINYTIPYELGIRGALVNMAQYDDFKESTDGYEPGFFMTGSINDGIYSMPETMNFWVLFYRTDVLEKLNLEIPKTMDDVIDMLPKLQMRGLNFYYPTAGMTLMRNFHGTTPLIVQNGGSLYAKTAANGTAIGNEKSVNGFTKLTDLFTVYNMPVNVDNFYQHFRNGDMPIGIADYATFNMLTNAAPELSSSWKVVLRNQTELLTVQSVDVLRAVLSLRAILRDRRRHGNLLNGGLQQRHRQSLDRLFRLHMVVNISGLRQIQKRLHSFL